MRSICSLVIVLLFYTNISAQDKPNILWIVSEDNNAATLHCYGNNVATTPNLDKLAASGIRYKNAFSTAPVCAPSRNTLITGMYPPSTGTEHMRSEYPVPAFVKFFPRYLREAGYYTTNNSKKDYNTVDQPEAWNESSDKATYRNRKPGQPFFAVFNLFVSHESSIHKRQDSLRHDPANVMLPPYHPDTKEFREDWAQYADKIETMDQQAGKLLQELRDAGLADNTIVFYYGDNGGVLPRSKRFMFESGLHVPLIVYLPPKYQHLSDAKPGTVPERLVTFLDFAPTILSITGIEVPKYMQGRAFLGGQKQTARDIAPGFRGRMDERIDMSRSVRDERYRYIRNYLPHRIYGQPLDYLWRAASMRSWEQAYKAGGLNETQAAFWKEKPSEELYDVDADPDNVHNLVSDTNHHDDLLRLRKANHDWILETRDAGFLPEAILYRLAKEKESIYEFIQRDKDFPRIVETAERASSRDKNDLSLIIKRLDDPNASVRYWAATGSIVLHAGAANAKPQLLKLLSDPEIAVRIAAAEALYYVGEKEKGIHALSQALEDKNPFAQLQALNALQAIGADALPALESVKRLVPANVQGDDYVARAAKTLVETLQH